MFKEGSRRAECSRIRSGASQSGERLTGDPLGEGGGVPGEHLSRTLLLSARAGEYPVIGM